jgi:hypothetical protein
LRQRTFRDRAIVVEVAVPSLAEPRQLEWSYLWENDLIPSFSVAAHKVITLEKGYRLLLKGVMCSTTSKHTAIGSDAQHKIWIVIATPGFLGDRFFFMTDALTFDPSQEIRADHTLYLFFHNQSSEKARITVNIIGIKEKVEK